MFLEFRSSYIQIQHTAGTGPAVCWGVKDGSIVTITSVVTKLVG